MLFLLGRGKRDDDRVVVAVVFLVVNIAKLNGKKKQTANVTQRNVPVIEWSAVQNLLDEK
mgnify:CR=1 FL=1